MRDFKKHRNRNAEYLRLAVTAAGVCALLVVTVFAVKAAWDMYGKLAEAEQGQEAAEAALSNVEAQQKSVATSVAELSTDRGTEAQIRERFGVAKPGEGVIEIVRDTGTTTPAKPASKSLMWRIFRTLFIW